MLAPNEWKLDVRTRVADVVPVIVGMDCDVFVTARNWLLIHPAIALIFRILRLAKQI
jgi:hypothetical protein